ncbi:cysteine-rich receptor-like protein kinase 15 isoform X3 [Vigna unguiculata]|uniref:cysteine-rich receptor-like protein kinase 15 isoform X3 n=1 Tax=Vigna unguiculata TaxID=3917 RepID=UPI001016D94E|nr:cysteine-rich receptor-like protein kinase 15 isoform X3 [Vigna unguiculata]
MTMVKHRPSSSVLLFLFIVFIFMSSLNRVSGEDPIDIYCPTEFPLYNLNSSFHDNLNLVLGLLSSDNASKAGFYNTSIGEEPNKVYGQSLCRGDISNSTVCKECIEKASQDIMNSCRSENAMIWYNLCQVRYSFQSFDVVAYTGKYPKQNDEEKNVSDPIRFREYLSFLMNNLSTEAASVKNMFAAGEIDYPGKKTIYGLVQCTRDMSLENCGSCLSSAFTEITACCSYREGGIILSRTCNMRFQMSQFFNASSAYLLVYPTSTGGKWKSWMFVLIICGSIFVLALVVGLGIACLRGKNNRDRDKEMSERTLLQELTTPKHVAVTEEGDLISSDEMLFMTLASIRVATDEFSDTNKLGQGGFGAVYKGVLPDGNEVAVKRLSRKSWQGIEEFKNEVVLIAKLQHKNLVRLLGCALEGEEKLLIYEFMSNKSLDQLIFDPEKRSKLDWKTYNGIINGIARGLLYLHEESRLKIIHRDLKPNNVLLDYDLSAKISDFGMARIFSENQNAANTKRVVGTYGYMAPEYAMEGLFSVKSDVFSFGVILLEIISGKRNSGFYQTELAPTLLAYAWRVWNEGKALDFVDPVLLESCPASEVVRCMHIGLLCVQENPEHRPTMSTVMLLQGSESVVLPQPKQPAFSLSRVLRLDPSTKTNPSEKEIIFSDILPR